VAEAGIFHAAALRRAISDRVSDWGVADAPALAEFVVH
jgi:acyl-[acyl-carrier-protein] desaturase